MKRSDINIRDPFVLVYGGAYYLYGTQGATCWGPADGFDVYVSRDLEEWEGPFVCFQNDGTFWADRNYWAPEVHPWQGAFFMFASFKSEGRCRGTAILKAASPAGPFVPWSAGPVTPPDWECLDGTFYADRQGNPCIFPASLYPELLTLAGDCGGKQVIRAHPELVTEVPVPAEELRDVDTPADLKSL